MFGQWLWRVLCAFAVRVRFVAFGRVVAFLWLEGYRVFEVIYKTNTKVFVYLANLNITPAILNEVVNSVIVAAIRRRSILFNLFSDPPQILYKI